MKRMNLCRAPALSATLCLLCVAFSDSAQAGNLTGRELGDPVYRDFDLGGGLTIGHAALYSGVGTTHRIIEMQADIGIAGRMREIDLSTVEGPGYQGAFQLAFSAHTFSGRRSVLLTAQTLLGLSDISFPLLGEACLTPTAEWGPRVEPSEIDELRSDGVVEYCYEFNGFQVWGRDGVNYDISVHPLEHNDLFDFVFPHNPCTELAPVVQRGGDPRWPSTIGECTFMTLPAAVDFPAIIVTATQSLGRTEATIRATDQSGIHRIRYRWGSEGPVFEWGNPLQIPERDFEEVVAVTSVTEDLYVSAQDGAGNEDGFWHVFPIGVDKPSVTVSAPDPFASEPGPNTGHFRISRTGSTSSDLEVHFTMGGGASNGTDYTMISGPRTIPAGSSHVDVLVQPLDDTLHEGSETVTLTLSADSAYELGLPRSATVTIQDNELPTVTVTAPDAFASEPGTDAGYFRISRMGNTSLSLTVNFTLSGTATNGTDHEAIFGPVTILPGFSSVDIPVVPIDDALVESNETVVLTLSFRSDYIIGSPKSATVTIADDDLGNDDFADRIIFTGSVVNQRPAGSNEGATTEAGEPTAHGTHSLWYEWTAPATGPVEIHTFGSDFDTALGVYTGSSVVNLTEVASNDDFCFFVFCFFESVVDFTATEGTSYKIAVGGSPGSPFGEEGSVVLTVVQDPPAFITMEVPDPTATESGSNAGLFRILREGPVDSSLTVYFLLEGSATNGMDYNAISGTATILPGNNSADVPVIPLDDVLVEGNESVVLTLTLSPQLDYFGVQPADPRDRTVTIFDDDPSNDAFADRVAISGSNGRATGANIGATTEAGEPTAHGSASVWWSWTAPVTGQATFDTNGSNFDTQLGVYTGSSVSGLTEVASDDDGGDGLNSLVTFSATAGTDYKIAVGGFGSSTGTVTLNWTQGRPTVTVTAPDATASEPWSDGGLYRISRTGGTESSLIVHFTMGGSATNGTDYNTVRSPVTIPAGSASVDVPLSLRDDSVREPEETAVLTLLAQIDYDIGTPGSATVTIQDDDPDAGRDRFEDDDEPAEAVPIQPGECQCDRSIDEPSDWDWATFTLTSTQTVHAWAVAEGAHSPELVLYLIRFTPALDILGVSVGLAANVETTVGPGTYYLLVEDWNHNETVVDYTLCLDTDGDGFEPDGIICEAKPIALPEGQIRDISPVGDLDWATFTLDVPRSVHAWISGASSDLVLYIIRDTPPEGELQDPASEIVAVDSGQSVDLFADLPAGEYHLLVHDQGHDETVQGYFLGLVDNDDPPEIDSNCSPVPLPEGHIFLRSIYPRGDLDWMTFDLDQQRNVAVGVTGASADLVLYLFNITGAPPCSLGSLVGLAVGQDALVSPNPLPSGEYLIMVEQHDHMQEVPIYAISWGSLTASGAPEWVEISPGVAPAAAPSEDQDDQTSASAIDEE